MESNDPERHDQNADQIDDPPPDHPHVVGTYDRSVASGPEHQVDLAADPDQSMIIETDKIRDSDSDQARPGQVIAVPVEIADSKAKNGQGDRSGPAKGDSKGAKGDSKGSEPDPKAQQKPAQAAKPTSLAKTLLFSAAVGLACGAGGAWAYSAFSGSGKADSSKASAKGGDSKKKSGSGQGSKSGKGSNPGEGPASGGDSENPGDDQGKGQGQGGDPSWAATMKELREARDAEREAKGATDQTKVVLEFFKMTLLSAGRPGEGSLTDAFWAGGQSKDVSLRKAVDLAESRVAGAFATQPTAEATVREMLGVAYINLGEAALSAKQFERALALRQAMQGFSAPETSSCRNQLAVAYRLAGRADEGGRLFDRNAGTLPQADSLAIEGATLLLQGNPGEAELKLRQALEIRKKLRSEDWATFDATSDLGEALLDQKRYAEAEPMLLSGYEGLKRREVAIPPADKARLGRAAERLVKLYDAWGRKDDARKWRDQSASSPDPASK